MVVSLGPSYLKSDLISYEYTYRVKLANFAN